MDLYHRGPCKFSHSFVLETKAGRASKTHLRKPKLTNFQLTVVIACVGLVFMRSFPDRAKSNSLKFLSEEERLCILARVNQDRGDAVTEKFNIKLWARSGLDWKIWAYGK